MSLTRSDTLKCPTCGAPMLVGSEPPICSHLFSHELPRPARDLAVARELARSTPPAAPADADERLLVALAREWEEWAAIRDEMIGAGKLPTAWQVSLEQRKRMLARGERPAEASALLPSPAVPR